MKCLRAIFGSEALFFSGGVKILLFFCDLKWQLLLTNKVQQRGLLRSNNLRGTYENRTGGMGSKESGERISVPLMTWTWERTPAGEELQPLCGGKPCSTSRSVTMHEAFFHSYMRLQKTSLFGSENSTFCVYMPLSILFRSVTKRDKELQGATKL